MQQLRRALEHEFADCPDVSGRLHMFGALGCGSCRRRGDLPLRGGAFSGRWQSMVGHLCETMKPSLPFGQSVKLSEARCLLETPFVVPVFVALVFGHQMLCVWQLIDRSLYWWVMLILASSLLYFLVYEVLLTTGSAKYWH